MSTLLSSRFEDALVYAVQAHAGQLRKGTEIPYAAHLLAVAALVLEDGGDEDEADRQLKKGELKFVLLGEKLAGSWVLVRTRGTRQWLLIKHRDEYASDEDVTITKPLSVVSGRTMAEIAQAAGASPRQLQQARAADAVLPRVAAAASGRGPSGTKRRATPTGPGLPLRSESTRRRRARRPPAVSAQ